MIESNEKLNVKQVCEMEIEKCLNSIEKTMKKDKSQEKKDKFKAKKENEIKQFNWVLSVAENNQKFVNKFFCVNTGNQFYPNRYNIDIEGMMCEYWVQKQMTIEERNKLKKENGFEI